MLVPKQTTVHRAEALCQNKKLRKWFPYDTSGRPPEWEAALLYC